MSIEDIFNSRAVNSNNLSSCFFALFPNAFLYDFKHPKKKREGGGVGVEEFPHFSSTQIEQPSSHYYARSRWCWSGIERAWVGLRNPPPWDSRLPFWDARYSRATTMSLIRGRNVGCSWRHIAVTAIAWWRHRTGKWPSRRGSASWRNFLRSLRNSRDCKEEILVTPYMVKPSVQNILIQGIITHRKVWKRFFWQFDHNVGCHGHVYIVAGLAASC